MKWYIQAIKNYVNFNGRARRKEYWMYILFSFVFAIVAMILDIALGIDFKISIYDENLHWNYNYKPKVSLGYGPIYVIVSLFHFLPSMSAAIRRLHDSDRTGWWLFSPLLIMLFAVFIGLAFVGSGFAINSDSMAGIGIILMLLLYLAALGITITSFVFLCFDGTKGDNRFGPSNKYDSEGNLLSK